MFNQWWHYACTELTRHEISASINPQTAVVVAHKTRHFTRRAVPRTRQTGPHSGPVYRPRRFSLSFSRNNAYYFCFFSFKFFSVDVTGDRRRYLIVVAMSRKRSVLSVAVTSRNRSIRRDESPAARHSTAVFRRVNVARRVSRSRVWTDHFRRAAALPVPRPRRYSPKTKSNVPPRRPFRLTLSGLNAMALEPEEHFKTPEWVSKLENKHKRVSVREFTGFCNVYPPRTIIQLTSVRRTLSIMGTAKVVPEITFIWDGAFV